MAPPQLVRHRTPKSKSKAKKKAKKGLVRDLLRNAVRKFPLIRELSELQDQSDLAVKLSKLSKTREAQARAADAIEEYVILPAKGTRAPAGSVAHDFLIELYENPVVQLAKAAVDFGMSSNSEFELSAVQGSIRVLDSLAENGAKLVEMTASERLALKTMQPELRIIREVSYTPQDFHLFGPEESPPGSTSPSTKRVVSVLVKDKNGAPVPRVTVIGFTDLTKKVGAEGITGASGVAALSVNNSVQTFEFLLARREEGIWGSFVQNAPITSSITLTVEAINLAAVDCVSHFIGAGGAAVGATVKVGVVDSGIGPHPDLVVAVGENTVKGEDPADFKNNGSSHGTHVAGIIASRGKAPNGRPGIAPGVELHSYRVFGKNSREAKAFAISRAIDAASLAGCHLINLSLGGGPPNDLVSDAIEDARDRGSLCIIAAGNDNRSGVSFPAMAAHAVSVSAMGRVGTFPSLALQVLNNLKPPSGTDAANFIASFSNFGPEIDVVGPGVGVVATVLGGYGAMNGTSMACPAVTGALARRLGSKPQILALQGAQRTDAMLQELLLAAKDLGFPAEFQGRGLPT